MRRLDPSAATAVAGMLLLPVLLAACTAGESQVSEPAVATLTEPFPTRTPGAATPTSVQTPSATSSPAPEPASDRLVVIRY